MTELEKLGIELARAIMRLESSPLQTDYVPPDIVSKARFLVTAAGAAP